VETIGRIRREHFIKGKTIREIARDRKVSRNTVRKVLRSGCGIVSSTTRRLRNGSCLPQISQAL
jgi:predicted transcriptional regulator